MTTLAAAWETLSGPRVEDYWVELLQVQEVAPAPPLSAASASFEDGSTGAWRVGGAGLPVISSSSARARHGSRSLEVSWVSGGGFPHVALDLATVAGFTYTVRLWVWVQAGSPAVYLQVTGADPGAASAATGDWVELTTTWTATGASSALGVWPTSGPVDGHKLWIDDVTVSGGPEGSRYVESNAGRLDGVTGCRVEHNVNAVIRGGCQLSLRDVGQDLDWNRVRFRPWARVNDLTWPLGVFLPASPSLSHDEHGLAWEVPCLDKLSILDQDMTTQTYSVPAGAVVTDEVAALIASVGERSAVTASDLTARSAMTWEPGTTKLRIVNDLLDSINYFALWADRNGLLRAEPYRRPQDRTLAATFARGEAAIHSPRWSREQDIAAVPNRVVLKVEGDDENPGMVAVADNTDPSSPYSIPARAGRIVARPYDNVEASSQAVLDSLAARYLTDASSPSATLSVSHAAVPLDGNDVVRFASQGVDTLAVVEGYSVDLKAGALMTGTWREVRA